MNEQIIGPVIDPQSDDFLNRKAAIPYTTSVPTFNPSYNGYRTVYYDGADYYLYIYVNGGWRNQKLGVTVPTAPTTLIGNATSTVSVSNTTTETDLMSFSVAGNLLSTNKVFKGRAFFQIQNNTAGAHTATIRLYYGSGSVAASSANIQNAGTFMYVADFYVLGAGTTSDQALGLSVVKLMDAPANLNQINNMYGVGSATTDSTATQTLKLTGQLDTASASFVITFYSGFAEKTA